MDKTFQSIKISSSESNIEMSYLKVKPKFLQKLDKKEIPLSFGNAVTNIRRRRSPPSVSSARTQQQVKNVPPEKPKAKQSVDPIMETRILRVELNKVSSKHFCPPKLHSTYKIPRIKRQPKEPAIKLNDDSRESPVRILRDRHAFITSIKIERHDSPIPAKKDIKFELTDYDQAQELDAPELFPEDNDNMEIVTADNDEEVVPKKSTNSSIDLILELHPSQEDIWFVNKIFTED